MRWILVALVACTSAPQSTARVFDIAHAVWVPGGGPGATRAMIEGDPERAGPYVQLIRVPAGSISRAHVYSDDRVYTVIEGTWYVGFGPHYDEAALVGLHAGSYYTLPAGTAVFHATRDDGAVIQIRGHGPTVHRELEASAENR